MFKYCAVIKVDNMFTITYGVCNSKVVGLTCTVFATNGAMLSSLQISGFDSVRAFYLIYRIQKSYAVIVAYSNTKHHLLYEN